MQASKEVVLGRIEELERNSESLSEAQAALIQKTLADFESRILTAITGAIKEVNKTPLRAAQEPGNRKNEVVPAVYYVDLEQELRESLLNKPSITAEPLLDQV